MAVVTCGEYHVTLWLHTAHDPPADEWDRAMNRIAELKRSLGGDVSNFRALVLSDGGAPNTVQRGEVFVKLLEGKSKAGLVTTSLTNRLKRGIATAISWLNPNFRAHSPDQFGLVLQHLDLEGHQDMLLAELAKIQRDMPTIETLSILLASSKK